METSQQYKVDTQLTFDVAVLGDISHTLRRSCLWACRQAGVIPKRIVKVNKNNAIVVPSNNTQELHVRIKSTTGKGAVASNTSWSLDPSLVQRGWGSKAAKRVRKVISSPDVSEGKCTYKISKALMKK